MRLRLYTRCPRFSYGSYVSFEIIETSEIIEASEISVATVPRVYSKAVCEVSGIEHLSEIGKLHLAQVTGLARATLKCDSLYKTVVYLMRGIGMGTVCNQLNLTERRRIEHSFGSQTLDDLATYTDLSPKFPPALSGVLGVNALLPLRPF